MVEDLTRARNRLDEVLVAASLGVARRIELDVQASALARRAALRRPGLGGDVRALPSHASRYATRASKRSRPTWSAYFDRPPFGDQVPRLGAYRGVTRMGGAVPRGRGVRLAALPRGARVHVVHRSGPLGELDRPERTSRQDHPRRQPPPPRPARRSRLVVPASAPRRRRHQAPASKDSHPRSSPAPGTRKLRLSSRFRQLGARKNVRSVVAAAVARELAGFLWAEMTTDLAALIMTTLEHHAIGVAMLEPSATRRDTAAAESIPAGNTATTTVGDTDAHILGHPPAHARTAIIDSRTPLWRFPDPRRPGASPTPQPTTTPTSRGPRSSRHPAVKVVRPRCAAGAPP